MITETANVVSIEKKQGEVVARIEYVSKSSCSGCSSKSNCGVGVVSEAFTDKTLSFDVPYQTGMKVDHPIYLNITNADLVKTASLFYLLPLFFFIGSALALKRFADINEIALIAISIAFTLVGFLISRYLAHYLFPIKADNHYMTVKTRQ